MRYALRMNTSTDDISATYEQALRQYFNHCRARVPDYVKSHFQYPGVVKTNCRALGWDLLRSPLNLFWAPFYLLLMITAFVSKKLKLKTLHCWLINTPGGITTNVQAYVAEKIRTELLRVQDITGETEDFVAHKIATSHSPIHNALAPLIESSLNQYVLTRTASADITNSLASFIIGALAWKKFAMGAFAIGLLVAVEINHYLAVENFILGRSIGALYYSVFPEDPSFTMRLIGVCLTLVLMAIVAPLSGFISDPIQSIFGIHQRRLHKMIDTLEKDVLQRNDSRYKPKDQYLARLADTIDAIKTQII